ncbi:MAG: hypothetical protein HY040_16130 [Planctomycetes bacterium]|nr:hypothetical protein [Planctomycetota bacterium]
MKRKYIVTCLLLMAAVAFGIWLDPTRVVWGWLRGEAFYKGRPTSWWRLELSRWESVDTGDFIAPNHPIKAWLRKPTWLETLVFKTDPKKTLTYSINERYEWAEDANPMLRKLLTAPEKNVRDISAEGLWGRRSQLTVEDLVDVLDAGQPHLPQPDREKPK